MKGKDQSFVMRAPPRRRVKGEDPDDQPVFLRKAFTMMSTCPPEIGGWSTNGDTIVIKDMKLFAEEVIPTAYKHNNFSSFVRQLNFYGFRKVKSESMNHAEWWEFRHPHFLRDEPKLLSEIKRSVHFSEASAGQEVHELRSQVTDLHERIAAMSDQMDRLTGMVSGMQLGASNTESGNDAQKKRKVVIKREPSFSNIGAIPLQRLASTDSTMMVGEYEAAGESLPSGPELLMMNDNEDFFSEKHNTRKYSDERNQDEEDDMDMFFSETADILMEDELPRASAVPHRTGHSTSASSTGAPTASTAAPTAAAIGAVSAAANEISSVLDGLSPELRLRFVDRLAEVMGAQLTQNISHVVQREQQEKKVEEAPVVASVAYTPQCEVAQFRLPSGSEAPEIALPLASAAIAALLSSMQSFANSQMHNSAQSHSQAPHLVNIKEEVICK